MQQSTLFKPKVCFSHCHLNAVYGNSGFREDHNRREHNFIFLKGNIFYNNNVIIISAKTRFAFLKGNISS